MTKNRMMTLRYEHSVHYRFVEKNVWGWRDAISNIKHDKRPHILLEINKNQNRRGLVRGRHDGISRESTFDLQSDLMIAEDISRILLKIIIHLFVEIFFYTFFVSLFFQGTLLLFRK